VRPWPALRDDRLTDSSVDGREAGYIDAIRAAARAIRAARDSGGRIVGVASPFAANEDLFVLRELLEAIDAEPAVFSVPLGEADELLIKAEKAPNAAGARALGFRESSDALGSAAVAIVLGHSLPEAAFGGVERLILIDTHASPLAKRSHIQLPAAHFAEKEGTFTNHANRVQRFRPIVAPTFEAWPEGDVLHQIAVELGLEGFAGRYSVREVSKRLAESVKAFAGIDLDGLPEEGRELA
jgi:NADH dehydrogenase/NADH:ubiquinone oxidoreductase subunit G